MKRRLSDSAEFLPSKRRKIDPEIEAQLLEDLANDIKTDEPCSAEEELLLNSDDKEQLRQLIDRLPDLNQRFGYIKQTPLMILIENGMVDLAEYLIKEKKVDLTLSDANGQSALHYACENAAEEIAGLIIDQMKDDEDYLNQLDGDAISPLIFAVQNGCTNIIQKLLDLEVEWHYTYNNGQEEMSSLLQANDAEIFGEFKTRLCSEYFEHIEKTEEQAAIVNKAIENSDIEILEEILPNRTLETYFMGGEENSCEEDSGTENEHHVDPLALAVRVGNEEMIRYLAGRKAWFKNLAHVAVDTDNLHTVKLMHELGNMIDDVKSLRSAFEAAIENENYAMLEYLFNDIELHKELKLEGGKLFCNAAVLVPDSSSFARLMLKHGAELPRKLFSWDMNPFAQDFHDRYLRSHLFGPKIEWWSPEEANYIRDVSYPVGPASADTSVNDGVSHLLASSNDSKRAIFGYLNCLEDILSLMFTCTQFCEMIDSQDYWKAQWFATYELAVVDCAEDVDWKKMFLEMDKLFKFKKEIKKRFSSKSERWIFAEGSYNYEVCDKDGTTRMHTIVPDPNEPASHFITCGLDQEINFDVADAPLPKDKITQFLPSGKIGFVTYDGPSE